MKTMRSVARSGWVQILEVAIAGSVLLWISVFNGYPLVYPDTGQYLIDSFTFDVPSFRTIYYPVFMRLTSFGITPWLIVFAQSALTVFVLCLCLEFVLEHNVSSRLRTHLLLGVVLWLACATTLPWYVGQLMPDIFASLLFLSMFLLLYDQRLTTGKSVALALVVAVSTASHLSHLVSSVVILLAIAVLRAFRRTQCFWPARAKKQLAWFVLTPILAGSFAVALSNWSAGWGFTLSPAGRMFIVARLFASGLAQRYLQQDCKVEHLKACEYADNLPSNENQFLWGHSPVFEAMGGWNNSKREASKIIRGTVRNSPGALLWECTKQMFRQFITMKPGEGNESLEETMPYFIKNFRRFYPEDVPTLEATEQWRGGLKELAHRLSGVDTVVFWCSMGGCWLFIVWRRRYTDPEGKLFVFVFICLWSNALVAGSLSNVTNRYQSRVSWLMAFCFTAYLVSLFSRRSGLFSSINSSASSLDSFPVDWPTAGAAPGTPSHESRK
jgi:hypothetical protein